MASGIRLKETPPGDIETPPTGKVTLFLPDDTVIPSYKDEAGVVHSLVGADGAPGVDGDDGAPGVDGTTWYNGAGAPGGGLGIDGDYYLNDSNGDYYLKAGGVWGVEGNILGPQGAAGSTLNPAAFIYAYNTFR